MDEVLFGAVAKAFGVGTYVSAAPLGGVGSFNVALRTTAGHFVVKVLRPPFDLASREAEAAFCARVGAYDDRVPTFRRTAEGGVVCSAHGRHAMLLPRLPGKSPDRLNRRMRQEVGRMVGRLRDVITDGLPPKRGWLSPAEHDARIARLRAEFPRHPGVQRIIALHDEQADFRERVMPTLPTSLIHGDVHPGNTLFEGDRIVALLDWEDAEVGPSVLDFAMTVRQCCFEGGFSAVSYRTLYAAYAQSDPATAEELDAMTGATRHVGVVQAAWRFLAHHVYAPRDDLRDAYKELWTLGIDRWVAPPSTGPHRRLP